MTNAVLDRRFALRACIVNFRTSWPTRARSRTGVARIGRAVDAELRRAAVAEGGAR